MASDWKQRDMFQDDLDEIFRTGVHRRPKSLVVQARLAAIAAETQQQNTNALRTAATVVQVYVSHEAMAIAKRLAPK